MAPSYLYNLWLPLKANVGVEQGQLTPASSSSVDRDEEEDRTYNKNLHLISAISLFKKVTTALQKQVGHLFLASGTFIYLAINPMIKTGCRFSRGALRGRLNCYTIFPMAKPSKSGHSQLPALFFTRAGWRSTGQGRTAIICTWGMSQGEGYLAEGHGLPHLRYGKKTEWEEERLFILFSSHDHELVQ